jgi:hypothetical protein
MPFISCLSWSDDGFFDTLLPLISVEDDRVVVLESNDIIKYRAVNPPDSVNLKLKISSSLDAVVLEEDMVKYRSNWFYLVRQLFGNTIINNHITPCFNGMKE